MRQPSQGVRLVHELGELGAAEELFERSHYRPDVDDGLRSDGIHVFRGHPLAHHAFHPV